MLRSFSAANAPFEACTTVGVNPVALRDLHALLRKQVVKGRVEAEPTMASAKSR